MFSKSHPCDKFLSDKDFLEHMIPHHQVAVEISYRMALQTQDPIILLLCRNITWSQKNQIWQMKMLWDSAILPEITNDLNCSQGTIGPKPKKWKFQYYYPCESEDRDTVCGMHFFDPSIDHVQQMMMTEKHNVVAHNDKDNKYQKVWETISDPLASSCTTQKGRLTSKQFLQHMIPHHQVAVNMCNRLMKHTKISVLRDLCEEIIRNQQYEIWYMNSLLQGYWKWMSGNMKMTEYPPCISCKDLPKGKCFPGS
jgi:uncharacterized protein (DUF305 family)